MKMLMSAVAVIASMVASGGVVSAATVNWIGPAGGSFADPANWSGTPAPPISSTYWGINGSSAVLTTDQGTTNWSGRSDLISASLTIHSGGRIIAGNSYWYGTNTLTMDGGYYGTMWMEVTPLNHLTMTLSGDAYFDNYYPGGNGYLYAPDSLTISDNATLRSYRGLWWDAATPVVQNGGTVDIIDGTYGIHFGTKAGTYDLNAGLLKIAGPNGINGSGHVYLAPGATIMLEGNWTSDISLGGRIVPDVPASFTGVYADGWTTIMDGSAEPPPSPVAEPAGLGMLGLALLSLGKRRS